MATYAAAQRQGYAKRGIALPDGSYPIPDRAALQDAIHAYGRAKPADREKVAAHIEKRAKALGAPVPNFGDQGASKNQQMNNFIRRKRRQVPATP